MAAPGNNWTISLVLVTGLWLAGASSGEASQLTVASSTSGGSGTSATTILWSVVGGPVLGRASGASTTLTFGFLTGEETLTTDSTPPTAPGQPAEGSPDQDYNGTGAYTIYWTAAADAESGISAYELQERIGAAGAWTSLISTLATTSYALSGRVDKTTYFYQVRAKNGVGTWGPFSPVSDGVLIDKTAPTAITTVTDDGAATASATQLHATWTPSTDPESGLAQYEYLIRQDNSSGLILVNYTSVGLVTQVTATGLNLLNGHLYYIGIRAKNQAGLYTTVKYSDGIRAPDPTPPSAPGQPTEGSPDQDYNGTGAYTIYWTAAADAESGISAYQLQQRLGLTGFWSTAAIVSAATSLSVSGRADQTSYYHRVRALNGVGLWSAYSLVSDGVLIDKTAPTASASVTDDGATTLSLTQLHATWTAATDAESGIADYQYEILQDSTAGTVIVPWTSVGSSTLSVTKTGLSLINGKSYFFGLRAVNGAGLLSATIRYSDGIQVQGDLTPPTGTITINAAASSTNTLSVTLTLSATDDSGTVSQMQCSNDNATYSAAEPYATSKTWTLTSGEGLKTVYVKFADPSGNWSNPVSDTITVDTRPPGVTLTFPQDGSVLGTNLKAISTQH